MDTKTQGAWILHHTGKLNLFAAVPDFENVSLAGKAGVLLSSLAASDESSLSLDQVRAFARAAEITKIELPGLLDLLQTEQLVEVEGASVHIYGVTTANLLSHTSHIFSGQNPSGEEKASLDLAERVSNEPRLESDLSEEVGDSFRLSSKQIQRLLASMRNLGLVDCEPVAGEGFLLFNGNLFRRDEAGKINAVLASLSSADDARIVEVDQLLRQRGCVEIGEVNRILTKSLFEKMRAIGFYDVNELANSKETVYFVTRPGAFGKFGDPFVEDALDLAKAFVACLSYGMTHRSPGTGRITMLTRLLTKLIAGAWIGPATAIGEDYRVLEMKRVIETRREGGNLFAMRLLKKEVGELALQVLTEGDASEQSLLILPTAAAARYAPPERTREAVRRTQGEPSKREMSKILRAIRTGS